MEDFNARALGEILIFSQTTRKVSTAALLAWR